MTSSQSVPPSAGIEPFQSWRRRRREAEFISLCGEIDAATAPRVAEQLTRLPESRVIVDMSRVTFVDSSGLNALVAASRRIDHHHGVLIIRGVPPHLLRLLEISGVEHLLNVERTQRS